MRIFEITYTLYIPNNIIPMIVQKNLINSSEISTYLIY